MNTVILPILYIITGFGYIIGAFVKAIISLERPINIFALWFKMRLLWKLQRLHRKIKERNARK